MVKLRSRVRYNLREVTSKLVQEPGLELRPPDSQTGTMSTLPSGQEGFMPVHVVWLPAECVLPQSSRSLPLLFCWHGNNPHVRWLVPLASFFVCLFFGFYLFIYLYLCWVFVSARGLSLVAPSGGHSSSRCAGLSLSRPLLLRSSGSRCAGSVVVVAHRPSCSAACGIFPDQGSNLCPLHWQVDSQPLRHQGSPPSCFLSNLRSDSAGVTYLNLKS